MRGLTILICFYYIVWQFYRRQLIGLGPIAFKVGEDEAVAKNDHNMVSFTSAFDSNVSRLWMKRDRMIIQKRGKEWKSSCRVAKSAQSVF